MSILIKNTILNNEKSDIYIKDNLIVDIGKELSYSANTVIDGTQTVACPSFINAHTHAAMTLMRGYADDMELMDWLSNAIWPLEAKLQAEDIYWGTKLACLEMIKSGTTSFIDMYYHVEEVAKATEDMGIRTLVGGVIFDHFDKDLAEKNKKIFLGEYEQSLKYPNAYFTPSPHAIYTVSKDTLKWIKDFTESNNLVKHIHLSETVTEVHNCQKEHGVSPVKYLADIGFLSDKTIAAHCIHLSDDDIKILADYDVKVVYNPISNLKLASGSNFRYKDLIANGVKVALGTDGASSNNNLNMLETAKFATLIQKSINSDPTIMPDDETMDMLTKPAEWITGLKLGKIKKGYIADLCLVSLDIPTMQPNHNFVSNLIYANNVHAIKTVLCNGKIVMENHKVESEKEILEKIPEVINNLLERK